MSKATEVEIKLLSLDLKNFRTTPQKDENDAVNAMISIKPERFFAVMESIIDDGYLPTENILVLKNGAQQIVREGNRRIAAMKIIHGILKIDDFPLPTSLKDKVKSLDAGWKKSNSKVPCTVYESNESDKVEKIVALSHAKGEKASRDPWSSVARARYDRDTKGIVVPALDILEKYLLHGRNLNGMQKDRWAGEFPLTVLEEAIRKIVPRLKYATASELANKYPKVDEVVQLEEMFKDIGSFQLETRQIRNIENGHDFAAAYGIPPLIVPPKPSPILPPKAGSAQNSNTSSGQQGTPTPHKATNPATSTPLTPVQSPPIPATVVPPVKSFASKDPKSVAAILKGFNPKGNDRQKIVSLRDELRKLKINDNPIAFSFILRSMFEISAKIYASENSIPLNKTNGGRTVDKSLIELLKDITTHLTSNSSNPGMNKVLHGATTEMSQPNRILSVTSMNQLVHNPSFSILPSDICIVFGNIYPLLEAMN